MSFDLLLRGGRVIDPAQGIDGARDLAIRGGRIAAVGEILPSNQAKKIIDVDGLIVTPGLIDFHAHVFWGISDLGVDADSTCLARGVTTVVDAGSPGAFNIDGFRKFIVEPARTRILCFLNIASIGMPSLRVGEVHDTKYVDVGAAVDAACANRDIVLGIKSRMSRFIVEDTGIASLHASIEAAGQAGLPVMVHIGESPVPLGDILDLLRPGDILTHTFTSTVGVAWKPDGSTYRIHRPRGTGLTILDAEGRVVPQLREAIQRGCCIDVGHGGGSFDFEVFRTAYAQGIRPDALSSDLSTFSVNGPVYDLPTVLSKFLALGLSLREVIRLATWRPAELIGMQEEIGSLREGACADVAAFELTDGPFEFVDPAGNVLMGEQKLVPRLVIRDGELCEKP